MAEVTRVRPTDLMPGDRVVGLEKIVREVRRIPNRPALLCVVFEDDSRAEFRCCQYMRIVAAKNRVVDTAH